VSVRLAGALGALLAAFAAGAAELPRLALEPGSLTASGLSSGGYMAVQFQLSHARIVRGVGVFAAGPWDCARGSLTRALAECMDRADSAPDAGALVARARAAADAGEIDPLAPTRVYVFHGRRDATVAPAVTRALVEFYRAFVPAADLRYVEDVDAGHGMPTESAGGDCGASAPPYLNACHYDGAGEMLSFLYEERGAGASAGAGELLGFDQAPYDPSGSLAAEGFLYVPRACRAGPPCRLHVAFHGCAQGAEFVAERFVREAGYNRWADAHRLVVLYPQAKKSALFPMNPAGCWDWWGYTDAHYATRAGVEVAAVRRMVRALAGY